jgi:hypothetical protein
MANRHLLTRRELPLFEAWATMQGWTSEPTKGPHEILRLTKDGETPIIIFAREGRTYPFHNVTVQTRDEQHVREWMLWEKKLRKAEKRMRACS